MCNGTKAINFIGKTSTNQLTFNGIRVAIDSIETNDRNTSENQSMVKEVKIAWPRQIFH